jgi:hypothetical protein
LLEVSRKLGSHSVQSRDMLIFKLNGHLDQAVFVLPMLIMSMAMMLVVAMLVVYVFVCHNDILSTQQVVIIRTISSSSSAS